MEVTSHPCTRYLYIVLDAEAVVLICLFPDAWSIGKCLTGTNHSNNCIGCFFVKLFPGKKKLINFFSSLPWPVPLQEPFLPNLQCLLIILAWTLSLCCPVPEVLRLVGIQDKSFLCISCFSCILLLWGGSGFWTKLKYKSSGHSS